MEKYRRARQAKDDYVACALHTGHVRLQTHTICNTHCFSTTAVVARTRLILRYTYIAWLVKNSPIFDTHGTHRARL